jgi:predicted RNA binding protein YcfA (HicA-like mRNA interferase family)
MSQWPRSKATRALAAPQGIGWQIKPQSGFHETLSRQGRPDFVFAFHDREEIGPRMLARIAKHTGLKPEDLRVFAMPTPSQPMHRPRSGGLR